MSEESHVRTELSHHILTSYSQSNEYKFYTQHPRTVEGALSPVMLNLNSTAISITHYFVVSAPRDDLPALNSQHCH